MRLFLLIAISLAASAATAQPAPRPVEVQLSSFDYTPEVIRLRAGEPVVLRLVNSGRGGHNFSAPEFFAAARLDDARAVRRGAIEVPSRQTLTVRLTPARGSYRLRCTHTLHSTLGMRGRILVE